MRVPFCGTPMRKEGEEEASLKEGLSMMMGTKLKMGVTGMKSAK